MKEHPAIPIKPLRLSGVFGITWRIIFQRFWPLFFYALTYILVAAAMVALFCLPFIHSLITAIKLIDIINASTSLSYAGYYLKVFASMISFMLLMGLGISAVAVVLNPIFLGCIYTEYSQRVYGRFSSYGEMMRRTKYMLKRFFTLNLCQTLAEWGFNMVFGIVSYMVTAIAMGASIFSVLGNPTNDAANMVAIIVTMVILMIALIFGRLLLFSLLTLTYPAAVNENVRNFSAVGRGISLARTRLWRIFGTALIVVAVCMMASTLINVLALLLGVGAGSAVMIPAAVLLILLTLVISVLQVLYLPALYTVLYFDARVRVDAGSWCKDGATFQAQPKEAEEARFARPGDTDAPMPCRGAQEAPEASRADGGGAQEGADDADDRQEP